MQAQDEATFFVSQVEPILRKRCFECHSHSSGEMSGKLTLDWRTGWETGGDRGPAIVPKEPDASLLIRAIRHSDPKLKMPEEKLPESEINILTKWVETGAFDDRKTADPTSSQKPSTDWWSLKPLQQPNLPGDPGQHPIDAFILSRLNMDGLSLSPEADHRTLIRRVTYDLIGLPPTIQEVEDFLADRDPKAYERVVDRLLHSQHYGERWARHWLDTIHFADSNGFEHDIARDEAWRYRDWLIQALNADIRWPRFIREQLAADYFFPDETQLTPALGYLGAGPFDLSAFSTAPVTFDYVDRDDMVTQTMASFASTTANCARCHAHKFDPISQEDYYSLQAVFAGVLKGNVAFDQNPTVLQRRRQLEGLIDAADRRDASVLLHSDNKSILDEWIRDQGVGTLWSELQPETYIASDGSLLSRIADNVISSGGPRPDKDTYTVTAEIKIKSLSAIRLEVLKNDTLPMLGPGRQENGNLHLSEIEAQLFEPNANGPKAIKFKRATADFDQTGWGVEKAIDGNLKTAWGIHPAVGNSHKAVFELASPIEIPLGSRLAIVMKQLHGSGHLVGCFRLTITQDDASHAAALPSEVEQALSVTSESRNESQRTAIAAYAIRNAATTKLSALPKQSVVYAAGRKVDIPSGEGKMDSRTTAEPKVVNVLFRGDFDKPKQIAAPGALTVLKHSPPRFELQNAKNEAERRGALAEWLAHRDNVLTWRSAVNRIWHYHFGRGLCDTPSDIGRMGGIPSHPELIDWLAVWFRDEAQGSIKSLHRLIVTSTTYRQSSEHREYAAYLDSDNRFLWRQNRQRLDADAIRDFTLSVSGSLDKTMGGPGVQHFKQSKGPQITPALDYSGFDWSDRRARRRSIYRVVWRCIPDPFLESIDFPDLGLLSPTRSFSVSSLQALAMYNNDFILFHSEAMAKEFASETVPLEEQVSQIVFRLWSRSPTSDELHSFCTFAQEHGLASLCRVLLNSNEFLFVN